ncbi:ATP-binding protein [Nitrosomonas sp.]|uniref:ATP-binding protein n=1 Tax=Nitrosomonas sp. TaxID=42353 RepID=UPI0025FF0AE6|nr:ATP-binding protein [Nitrosomonas sp.]MBV6446785.1 hypothetical protein [Nitrosomonas sp.]
MSENKKAEIDKELEISIPLKNFSYSGPENDHCRQNDLPKFFGRAKEKSRLLDHLKNGKYRSGSFLVAGYRGVGKTEFVSEVLCNYKKENGDFIEVKVNLGNDGDLTSKSVLFNMVYLLNNSVRSRWQIKFLKLLFGNIIRSLSLGAILLFPVFAAAYKFNLGS